MTSDLIRLRNEEARLAALLTNPYLTDFWDVYDRWKNVANAISQAEFEAALERDYG